MKTGSFAGVPLAQMARKYPSLDDTQKAETLSYLKNMSTSVEDLLEAASVSMDIKELRKVIAFRLSLAVQVCKDLSENPLVREMLKDNDD
jgi:hypothetical protein